MLESKAADGKSFAPPLSFPDRFFAFCMSRHGESLPVRACSAGIPLKYGRICAWEIMMQRTPHTTRP